MRFKTSARPVLFALALAASACFTARPPDLLPTAVPEWRDAPNDAPSAARAHRARDASSLSRRLTASALGMGHADPRGEPRLPLRPRAPERTATPPERGGVPGRGSAAVPGGRAPFAAVRDRGDRRDSLDRVFSLGGRTGAESRPREGATPGVAVPMRREPRGVRRQDVGDSRAAAPSRSSGARASSLFRPTLPPKAAARAGVRRTPSFRPPSLSRLLGGKALRPPPSSLRPPPDMAALILKRPSLDAAGRPVPEPARELRAIESVDPGELASDPRRDAHWDGEIWHERQARGLAREEGWLWFKKDRARWWGLVEKTPLARHQDHWWLRRNDVWWLLHEGQPWVLRHFSDWDSDGFFHPATGTEIVYSADLSRAAVIVPGEGAVVYDARSGAEIGRIPESAMPPRRRPRAPTSLSLP